ncbi:MAG TPA: oligopeptide ABC transporter permease [Anaerolineaceae bacterium]|nr:oligopeptide ABC transporter permease [Anaerolineaceae bacterium]
MTTTLVGIQPKHVKPATQEQLAWEQFKRHKVALIAIVIFIVMAILCLLAPVIAPYEFDEIDLKNRKSAPSAEHWLGTDDLGRDLFTRILYGGRISITIGMFSAVVGTVLGTLIGSVAGFFGGRLDNVLMRFTDIAYSIPMLPLLIVLSSYTKSAVPSMVLIIGLLSWMSTARVVRASTLSIKEKEYVEAAVSIGARSARLIWKHILPNIVGPIIIGTTLGVGNAIITESSLSFLGLGVQPPTPTWGNMLQQSQQTMITEPWLTIFPGMAILITVLCVNFIGDGLQDALDPTLRRY